MDPVCSRFLICSVGGFYYYIEIYYCWSCKGIVFGDLGGI